jgi:hypothetical protein
MPKIDRKNVTTSGISEDILSKIFNEKNVRRMGRLLDFLSLESQKIILHRLRKVHEDIPVFNLGERKAIFLSKLTLEQLFSIFKLLQKF